ncbi:MAG TPA: polysaccharide deacetylase family protein [Acidimicrobiales bacterium]|nr:polysaccharide deacetylase family protein [Acidimicrobiales bacterium]
MFRRLGYARSRGARLLAERLAAPASTLDAGSTGEGDEEASRIAITFDDGPDPEYTPRVLDALAARSAAATFFLVGDKAQRHPHLVQRILAEGHAVGSHTRSHPDMWTIPFPEIRRQYLDGRRLVEDVAGRDVPLVRPPKGWLDPLAGLVLRRHGFRTVLWNTAGDDWVAGQSAAAILGAIGTPVAGSVILLHDSIEAADDPAQLDRTATIEALGPLVDGLRLAGHQLVALN